MKRRTRRCRHCRCYFEVCPKVKDHQYCGNPACQKARKRNWQKRKLAENEVYRRDQKDAQRLWLGKNPGYWKTYRSEHPGYTEKNRIGQRRRNALSAGKLKSGKIAKMDAIMPKTHALSGRYKLVPLSVSRIAKMDALIVEIDVIKGSYDLFGP
jgi:hypothetical protein